MPTPLFSTSILEVLAPSVEHLIALLAVINIQAKASAIPTLRSA
ncbi:hypothetical protein [Meiothermus rufus]|nr:hypothetical protein [Meiothermus rufus]